MTKEQTFVAENNQLRQKLTSENEEFYSNLLLYVRTRSFIQDQEDIESKLLEILQDLLDAQSDNVSAEQYFGRNAKQVADELLTQFPRSLTKFFKDILFILGIYLFFIALPSMASPHSALDIGTGILNGFYLVLAIFLIFRFLSNTIYEAASKKATNWQKNIKPTLLGILLIVPIFLIQFFITTPFQITIGNRLGITIIVFWFVIGTILFVKQQDKKTWLPLVFFLLILGVLGIAQRLPGTIGSFLTTTTGQTTELIIVLTASAFFLLGNFILAKKN
ncbi:hypothetical protein LPAF129_07440 [Ligilactobacillus pabuli]|uniref:DUF1129 family protein n=1 Tax=Ligilactobacillus pabuli TaxID=2886039 RepID=A0ABQ5JIR4_9LACO|nr:hypothetical protein [Ligilactobacillus pabuli]GKS81059.1 hypothetical protein LPAF129_07440 [Ligilactobacillus pabuli]